VRNVVDEYYDVKVDDPYRYIEKLDDPEVAAWFKAQAAYTDGTLAAIPGRKALLARLQELNASTPAHLINGRRLPENRIYYEKTIRRRVRLQALRARRIPGHRAAAHRPRKVCHKCESAHGPRLVGTIA